MSAFEPEGGDEGVRSKTTLRVQRTLSDLFFIILRCSLCRTVNFTCWVLKAAQHHRLFQLKLKGGHCNLPRIVYLSSGIAHQNTEAFLHCGQDCGSRARYFFLARTAVFATRGLGVPFWMGTALHYKRCRVVDRAQLVARPSTTDRREKASLPPFVFLICHKSL